jgi:capsular exopolysaccharide synthesis family protein
VGAPVLGVVPKMTKAMIREGSLPNLNDNSQIGLKEEYFREIRAMAAFRIGDRRIIQLTSCVPREGKTLIAVNLAIALSETGKKVLLIDGDFYRAGVNDWFNINSYPGFSQFLFGEATADEIIQNGGSETLSIVSAGRTQGVSKKLFDTVHFKNAIESIDSDYDYIIIDSPPLLSVSAPLVWSQCVDGLIFVIDVDQVTSSMLTQSVNKLKELDVNILGVIMNRMSKFNNYYYYGYSSKYSYYNA